MANKDPTYDIKTFRLPTNSECVYAFLKSDGYGSTWKTSCGHTKYYESPTEVGWSSAPRPTEFGAYCSHCGKQILEVK